MLGSFALVIELIFPVFLSRLPCRNVSEKAIGPIKTELCVGISLLSAQKSEAYAVRRYKILDDPSGNERFNLL